MQLPASLSVDPDLAAIVRLMQEGIPFNAHLGMRADHAQRGEVVLRIPYSDVLIGDRRRPAIHGGVISTLADTAGGAACFTMLEAGEVVSTVDLRVDYLRPGPSADLVCAATVVRMGNRVAVARMHVYSGALPGADDEDRPIATAAGVYNVVRAND
jgi:uncharacterized protein (TIGR00369 family)